MKVITLAVLASLSLSSGAGAATIGLPGGPHVEVAGVAAGPLQCVLNALHAVGYPIRFIRGYGRGSVRGSLHPSGLALDVNQTSRGRTVPRMPHNEVSLAEACGALSGAVWHNNDSGHFQIGGYAGSARRRHHSRHRR